MTDTKTEQLTLTISNVPSELTDLIWAKVNSISQKEYGCPIDKVTNIDFYCDGMQDELILKLVASIITTHCALLNLNK